MALRFNGAVFQPGNRPSLVTRTTRGILKFDAFTIAVDPGPVASESRPCLSITSASSEKLATAEMA